MSEHEPNPNILPGEPPHGPSQNIAVGSPAHSAIHHAPEHAPDPFTDRQWEQLRQEDFAAARAVVLLMVGIFSLGVVIYSVVAWSVMS